MPFTLLWNGEICITQTIRLNTIRFNDRIQKAAFQRRKKRMRHHDRAIRTLRDKLFIKNCSNDRIFAPLIERSNLKKKKKKKIKNSKSDFKAHPKCISRHGLDSGLFSVSCSTHTTARKAQRLPSRNVYEKIKKQQQKSYPFSFCYRDMQ